LSLYEPICARCDENGIITLATEEHMGERYCGDCLSTMAEAAYERMCEDFYGGSQPVTIQEQYDAAVKERRELRSKD
jgi:hypothetical protein